MYLYLRCEFFVWCSQTWRKDISDIWCWWNMTNYICPSLQAFTRERWHPSELWVYVNHMGCVTEERCQEVSDASQLLSKCRDMLCLYDSPSCDTPSAAPPQTSSWSGRWRRETDRTVWAVEGSSPGCGPPACTSADRTEAVWSDLSDTVIKRDALSVASYLFFNAHKLKVEALNLRVHTLWLWLKTVLASIWHRYLSDCKELCLTVRFPAVITNGKKMMLLYKTAKDGQIKTPQQHHSVLMTTILFRSKTHHIISVLIVFSLLS